MPELPEVETLCRQLKQVILDKDILGISILDPKLTDRGGRTGGKEDLFRGPL